MASRRETTTGAKKATAKPAAASAKKKVAAKGADAKKKRAAPKAAAPARAATSRTAKAAPKPGKAAVTVPSVLTATEQDQIREEAMPTESARLRRALGPDSPPSGEPITVQQSDDDLRRSSEQSGKYVYCIIQSEEELRFGAIGIGAEPSEVHTVRYQDIAAVVSDAPIEVYDPTRENVLSHERVNEMVMRRHTVIPMSFGTVFNTRDDIVELLRSAYDAFRDVLTKMQNKLEFGLKVLWDPEQLITVLEAEDENLRRLKQEISSQRGSTYFARMQYGRLVDQLLQERSEAFVAHIFSALRDVSVASRANKPIGDRMILNAAFLVSRDQEAAFDQAVRAVGSELDNLTFRYTGPWPPYNFVNIRLKLERAKETE